MARRLPPSSVEQIVWIRPSGVLSERTVEKMTRAVLLNGTFIFEISHHREPASECISGALFPTLRVFLHSAAAVLGSVLGEGESNGLRQKLVDSSALRIAPKEDVHLKAKQHRSVDFEEAIQSLRRAEIDRRKITTSEA